MTDARSERRRSSRLFVQVSAVLRGTDASGRSFFDRGEAVAIDQCGARVRTRFQLKPGAEIQVGLPTEREEKVMRVVWCGDAAGFYEGMVGVEFADPNESWSMETLRVR
jgi:hypothetical protein